MIWRQKTKRVSVSALSKKISSDSHYLKSFLTSAEVRYCRAKKFFAEPAAARLAAKQACFALLEIPSKDLQKYIHAIEIRKSSLGQPVLKFSAAFKKTFPVLNECRILLSLAHEREVAIAWVAFVKVKP